MRILIETHHPAHIHFFKHPIRLWQERGHTVLVAGRDRDVMKQLFEAYSWIPYTLLTKAGAQNRFPVAEFLSRQIKLYSLIRKFKPDVFASVQGSYSQPAGTCSIPNLIFTDTEHQLVNQRMAFPFASRIYTPSCFFKDLGAKQQRYEGYHELSFIHPNRFSADPALLSKAGDLKPDSYAILRLCAWNTLHDIGHHGMGSGGIYEMIRRMEKRCRVCIVPEGKLPDDLESYHLQIHPALFHHVLAFARLVVSEGASTASEAACLGIPTIYINPLKVGYLQEQEERFGLAACFDRYEPALVKVDELLNHSSVKQEFCRRRTEMLKTKIDVADFVATEVEEAGPKR